MHLPRPPRGFGGGAGLAFRRHVSSPSSRRHDARGSPLQAWCGEMSVWRAALVARPQQATTHAPRLLQPRARPLSARRAVTRAAAQIGHAAVTAEEGQQDAAGGDSADSRCSLDTFLSARGAAGLLGWDVILHDTGAVVGTVAEVLRCVPVVLPSVWATRVLNTHLAARRAARWCSTSAAAALTPLMWRWTRWRSCWCWARCPAQRTTPPRTSCFASRASGARHCAQYAFPTQCTMR